MVSSSREEIVEAFDAVSGLLELSFAVLTTTERLALLERLEHETRRLPVPRHALIAGVRQQASPAELGGKLAHVLADRLHISRAEANRRIGEAHDLGRRRALTGEPPPPRLSATAAGQRAGAIGAGQISVIRRFIERLPCWVDGPTRERAEAQLARHAADFRPEQLAKLADKLADCLNPDGNVTDQDRARRRGLTLGPKMSMACRRCAAGSPGRARQPRSRVDQAGRPRHGQPLRPGPGAGWGAVAAGDRLRHPQPRPAQPRRPARRGARDTGVGKTRSAQRATGVHHRRSNCALLVHPTAGPDGGPVGNSWKIRYRPLRCLTVRRRIARGGALLRL
jgi:Domain of unknown function (DUF222)